MNRLMQQMARISSRRRRLGSVTIPQRQWFVTCESTTEACRLERVVDYPYADDGLPVLGDPDPPPSGTRGSPSITPARPALWLKIPRKGSGAPGVSYPDALSVALCYGWIDGQKGRLDDDYWLQRFTPAGPAASGPGSTATRPAP